MSDDAFAPCCDDFRSALEVTLVNPIESASGWLLYGTDYETTSAGHPELRYWPISYCPFCGARLKRLPSEQLPRPRAFGVE
jgi:hypothetical protein